MGSTSVEAADAGRATPVGAPGGLPVWVVLGAAVAGLGLRVAVFAGPLGRPSSDEVLTALMARHIGIDGFPAFVWGQHYGGTAELVPVAASLRVLGGSTLALRLPGVLLAVAISVLVWRLGRRLLGERGGQVAGLLSWVFPGTALWFGLREQLFYPLTVALGLGLVLLASRIGDQRRLTDWLAAGVVAGLAFWTSPFCIYFVLPAAVVAIVGLRRPGPPRRLLPGLVAATGGAAVAMAPWLGANVGQGWPSLHAGDGFPADGTYLHRLVSFFTDALPGVLGLRQAFTLRWVGGPFGVVVYVAVLVALGVGLVRALRAWRAGAGAPVAWDAIGLVLFPLVFAAFPFVTNDPIFRYAFFVVPFVIVVGMRALPVRGGGDRPSVGRAIAVLVAGTVLSALALQQLYVVTEVERAAGIGALDLAPALRVLDEHHVDAVYADYWIAYRIPFDTDERIIGVPTSGIDRYPPYDDAARRSPRAAWVVVPGAQQDALLADLAAGRVTAEVIPAGDVTVVLPATPVRPGEVSSAARNGSGP